MTHPISVLYITSCYMDRNGGHAGQQAKRSFASLEDAKNAPFPEGYTFARIVVEGGEWAYQSPHGWQFNATA